MGVRSIKMPDVGEGVAEAEIVEWAVKVGDLVKEDQVVAAVMTDKATVEIPTPVAGSVLALGGAVGDVLAVGAELIRIEAPGMPDSLAPAAPKSRPAQKEGAPPPSVRPAPEPRAEATPRTAPEHDFSAPLRAPQAQAAPPRPPGEKPLASPAVRLRAREAGVDLRFVRGSGPAGRITHEDLGSSSSPRSAKRACCSAGPASSACAGWAATPTPLSTSTTRSTGRSGTASPKQPPRPPPRTWTTPSRTTAARSSAASSAEGPKRSPGAPDEGRR